MFTIIDLHSKWAGAVALPAKRASLIGEEIVNFFNKSMLGKPEVIQSDNGGEFTGGCSVFIYLFTVLCVYVRAHACSFSQPAVSAVC